jgi:TatD DNase family protein
LTSGNFQDFETNLKLLQDIPEGLTTLGIHPCQSNTFPKTENEFFEKSRELIRLNRHFIAAIGECGLDYDRLHYSSKEN